MSSKKNRRKRSNERYAFQRSPGSIRGAWERYRFIWTAGGNQLELRERLAVTWQLLFALRWFMLPIGLGLIVLAAIALGRL